MLKYIVSALFNFPVSAFAFAIPSVVLYFKSIRLLKLVVSINLAFKYAGVVYRILLSAVFSFKLILLDKKLVSLPILLLSILAVSLKFIFKSIAV